MSYRNVFTEQKTKVLHELLQIDLLLKVITYKEHEMKQTFAS